VTGWGACSESSARRIGFVLGIGLSENDNDDNDHEKTNRCLHQLMTLLDLLEIEAWLALAHHASTPALAAAYLERARQRR
jgi:hypothetical protein